MSMCMILSSDPLSGSHSSEIISTDLLNLRQRDHHVTVHVYSCPSYAKVSAFPEFRVNFG